MTNAPAVATRLASAPDVAERKRLHRRIEAGFAAWRYRSMSRLALYAGLVPALLLWVLPPAVGLPAFLAATAWMFTMAAGLCFAVLAWGARQRLRGQEAVVVQAPPRAWRSLETTLLWVATLAAVVLGLPALEVVQIPAKALAAIGRVWAWSALVLVAAPIAAVLLPRPRSWPAIRAAAGSRPPAR